MNQQTIAFIGGGNMTRYIVLGLIANGYPPQKIWIANRSIEKLSYFKEECGVHVTQDNHEAIAAADLVIFSVKPQQLQAVCHSVAEEIRQRKPLVISVAVGITTQMLEKWLGASLAIVRAMPNTPCAVQAGAIGLFATNDVSSAEKNSAESIFRAVGLVVWVNDETQIDCVAALSGSGPAYVFLIMEALQQAGEKLGLTAETARLLVSQTLLGASRLAMESKDDVVQLRQSVTSKGGTTEQAIKVLESADIRSLFEKALAAAVHRAKEITQTLDIP